MNSKKYKEEVNREIDSLSNRIIEISETIWNYAEIGLKEYKSSELLANELKKHGFQVEKPIGGLETAFKATYKGKPGGPVIGLLAEYDRVRDPNLGHACGHNLMAASTTGAAIALSKLMPELRGTIAVYGCPDEEGVGGKIPMLEAGVFEKVDAAMQLHAGDRYKVYDTSLSIEMFYAVFKGRHASSSKAQYDHVNALDGVTLAFNAINILRNRVRPDVIVRYIVLKGGESPNVIPVEATVEIEVRAADDIYLATVVEKVKNCFRGAAQSIEGEVEFKKYGYTFKRMMPLLTLAQLFKKNLEELGQEVEEPAESVKIKVSHSTDFGNVSQVIPSCIFYIPIGPRGTTLHTPEGKEATRSETAKKSLIIGTKNFAMTAIDLFNNQRLVNKMKDELAALRDKDFIELPLVPTP